MQDELEYAFFNQDGNIVSAFAFIKPEEELGKYMEENYDEEDDDTPISEFAVDIGLCYYDHDGLEVVELNDNPLNGSYSEHFDKRFSNDLNNLNIHPKTIILLYGFDYKKLKHCGKKSRKVVFIGSYNYEV